MTSILSGGFFMALRLLSVGFNLLVFCCCLCFLLLYFKRGLLLHKVYVFIPIIFFSLLLAYINYNYQPYNFFLQKYLSICWGFCAIAALFLKPIRKVKFNTIRFLIFLSLFGTLLQLII